MGEYWKPANVTKRESLHPHQLDCGLKLVEWNYYGSPVLAAVRGMVDAGLWSADDDIQAVSDYGSSATFQGGNARSELSEDEASDAYSHFTNVTERWLTALRKRGSR